MINMKIKKSGSVDLNFKHDIKKKIENMQHILGSIINTFF